MPSSKRNNRFESQRGSALVLTLLILGSLALLGTSLVLSAVEDRTVTRYSRHSMEALGVAETGIAYGKHHIQDLTAPMEDADEDGRPDFTLSDSLTWGGGAYYLVAEATDVKGLGISAYRSNGFTLIAEGDFAGAIRRVKTQMVHDSFLKYARFVAATGTSYSCGAILTGAVHVGADLGVSCGCSSGDEVTFLEEVTAVGDIPNAGCAIFMRGYITDADPIDLDNSVDFTEIAQRAKGVAADNACEGVGMVGIYISLPSTDPLGLGSMAKTLNLSLFDFFDTTTQPPDTLVRYNGNLVMNTVTGSPLKNSDFNGIVFFQGDGRVKGRADGITSHNLTIFASDDMFVMNNLTTGHTGFDPFTRVANGTGNPVNLGLVANDYIYIDDDTPRVLDIDAALMAVHNNWCILDDEFGGSGSISSHPSAAPGPLDLDRDGIYGEAPVNNDPRPGEGWNEFTITSNTWVLNINGPIITYNGGNAWPWNDSSVLASASGPTRRYNYDLDITEFPPPCFPVPLNLWKDVSWTEIFETDSTLTSYMPN
ncbi:MAG: hypothetical protein KJ970_16240 [Candidatus Eisenbacteria bacterium]|uniref:Type 4 fimbrial biogenesis protein PilX N-terminal domain-containing protein n=1 Tax=Eiseniibacteriota bacterium TaxID=2212470 RepID=A0A948W896_UNCEI|nr:hypothetical protein [Candidatus Eisenbacteria bacterium]MBU1947348.1 hypothetical protein [Candidatus Eisenbacteria bacterium]MBU2692471.1 hypothetical protein [Candidatus Eisenbacteria bacterium]